MGHSDDEEREHESGGEERGGGARAGVEVWGHGGGCLGAIEDALSWRLAMATAEALRGLGCLGAVEGAVNEEGSNVEGVKEVRCAVMRWAL